MDRKGFHIVRIILTGLFLSICMNADAQELVPNGSFNYPDTCSQNSLLETDVEPWFSLLGAPEFYHICFQEWYSVPENVSGWSSPYLGDGYVGLSTFVSLFQGRKFVSVELLEVLTEGIDYHLEFHVSMADSVWYATRNIGGLLTPDVPEATQNYLLNAEPQVNYVGEAFLDNKIRWTRVEGSFTAVGGERYLTIGNFDDDANTDTLFVPGGGAYRPNQPDFWKTAYYYVDGVSLVPDSIYLSNEELGVRSDELEIYPNPATDAVTVETDRWRDMGLDLYDATGRQVLQHEFGSSRESISVGHLPRGVYVAILQENGVVVERRKLILQ